MKKLLLLSRFSHVGLCVTLWGAACQAPLSMGFSRQEYWNGLPCPPPGGLPNPGMEPGSPALQADALTSEPPGKPLAQHTTNNNQRVKSFPSQLESIED